jgi:hypothetical protein
LAQLRAYAARLNIAEPGGRTGMHRLTASGYVRADSPPFLLICDVALLARPLPAHAHADTLSFG